MTRLLGAWRDLVRDWADARGISAQAAAGEVILTGWGLFLIGVNLIGLAVLVPS